MLMSIGLIIIYPVCMIISLAVSPGNQFIKDINWLIKDGFKSKSW